MTVAASASAALADKAAVARADYFLVFAAPSAAVYGLQRPSQIGTARAPTRPIDTGAVAHHGPSGLDKSGVVELLCHEAEAFVDSLVKGNPKCARRSQARPPARARRSRVPGTSSHSSPTRTAACTRVRLPRSAAFRGRRGWSEPRAQPRCGTSWWRLASALSRSARGTSTWYTRWRWRCRPVCPRVHRALTEPQGFIKDRLRSVHAPASAGKEHKVLYQVRSQRAARTRACSLPTCEARRGSTSCWTWSGWPTAGRPRCGSRERSASSSCACVGTRCGVRACVRLCVCVCLRRSTRRQRFPPLERSSDELEAELKARFAAARERIKAAGGAQGRRRRACACLLVCGSGCTRDAHPARSACGE
jgi:hypothetical protein